MIAIHTDPVNVARRLAQLGLKEKQMADVVRRGYLAFASCTVNHPLLYPGFSAWAEMVAGLREYLLPEDWDRSDDKNYALVVNPTGTMAIAVATGDEATGRADMAPTTKSSKGPSTVDAVSSNNAQLELPYDFPPVVRPSVTDEQRMTWILLVHRAPGEVRCELSLPTSMGSDGRVDGWRERIILSAVPTDPDVALLLTPPTTPAPDVTIDIKRRA